MAETPIPEAPEEKETYTKEEMLKILREAQERQYQADDLRIHGNAFFAEALDHIGQLGARDPFWKTVYNYGIVFENQFKTNTGQVQTPQPAAQTSSQPVPKTRPDLKKPAGHPGSGSDETPGE